MGSKVPVSLDDEEWAELIKRKTVAQRVEYLEFVAVRRRRQTFTDNKVSRKATEFEQIMAEQNAIAEAGGMGYGPRLNELIMNPFRSSKQMNLIEGGRIWTAMRLERPRVIFDLQFTSKMEAKNFKVITRHLSYCVTENFHSRDPLPMSFANASRDNNEYRSLQHNIGHFKGEYTHQKIMPELALRDVRTLCGPDKNILYISRHAREMLDGPLTADGYVICASMDNERESLGAARKGGFRAVRLPIEKYVKWVSGHKVLPFPNIMRILREVHTSGGDWRTALHNNIAKRHFQSDEERESRGLTARTKLTRLARMELVQAIRDATGNK